jgi:hypothetical protein
MEMVLEEERWVCGFEGEEERFGVRGSHCKYFRKIDFDCVCLGLLFYL